MYNAKNLGHPCVLDDSCFPERGWFIILPVFQGISNSGVYTSHLGGLIKMYFLVQSVWGGA